MDDLLKTQMLATKARDGPLRALMESGLSMGYMIYNKEDGR
jgi:hypothetical protein